MEIARTPEIQPDRNGGKRWPSGRRRTPSPPRKPRPGDTTEPAPAEDRPAEPDAAASPPGPAQHVDVTV